MTKKQVLEYLKDFDVQILDWYSNKEKIVSLLRIDFNDNLYAEINTCNWSDLFRIKLDLEHLISLSDKQKYLLSLALSTNNLYNDGIRPIVIMETLTEEETDKFIEIFEWCNKYLARKLIYDKEDSYSYLLNNHRAIYKINNLGLITDATIEIDLEGINYIMEQFDMTKQFIQNLIFINKLKEN